MKDKTETYAKSKDALVQPRTFLMHNFKVAVEVTSTILSGLAHTHTEPKYDYCAHYISTYTNILENIS